MADHFIAGSWVPGQGTHFVSKNPADDNIVWDGLSASNTQIDTAVQSAHEAFPSWSDLSFEERLNYLTHFQKIIEIKRKQLTLNLAKELGKPFWDADSEIAAMINKLPISVEAFQERCKEYAKKANIGALKLKHKPHGVMAVFGPFNFPAYIPNGHIMPALLAGNTLILKSSELAPGIFAKQTVEVNFDGLVGPTHNYSGLPWGNIASMSNAFKISHPKAAALQGLQKMLLLKNLNILQAILPPHERPDLTMLRNLGFYGSDIQVLQQAKKTAPEIFYACYSSSSMWAANATTVSPSRDCMDKRIHITPANLLSHFHRFLETEFTSKILNKIFYDKTKFEVHSPLPPHVIFSDEGAANHNRICFDYNEPGIEIFVYGRLYNFIEHIHLAFLQIIQKHA